MDQTISLKIMLALLAITYVSAIDLGTEPNNTVEVTEDPFVVSYTPWTQYGPCLEEFGMGTKRRTRFCFTNKPSGCSGPFTETKECKIHHCPVNGGFTSWGAFQQCSKSCGGGSQLRFRTCTNPTPAHGGKECCGSASELKFCNYKQCPLHGGFTNWSSFGECSQSCGGGNKTRSRNCTNPVPAYGGKQCDGEHFEITSCNLESCPVDGGFTNWSNFGECSQSCGGGNKTRTRTCTDPAPAHGGNQCNGTFSETIDCNTERCPGCVWSVGEGTANGDAYSEVEQGFGYTKETCLDKCIKLRVTDSSINGVAFRRDSRCLCERNMDARLLDGRYVSCYILD